MSADEHLRLGAAVRQHGRGQHRPHDALRVLAAQRAGGGGPGQPHLGRGGARGGAGGLGQLQLWRAGEGGEDGGHQLPGGAASAPRDRLGPGRARQGQPARHGGPGQVIIEILNKF